MISQQPISYSPVKAQNLPARFWNKTDAFTFTISFNINIRSTGKYQLDNKNKII